VSVKLFGDPDAEFWRAGFGVMESETAREFAGCSLLTAVSWRLVLLFRPSIESAINNATSALD